MNEPKESEIPQKNAEIKVNANALQCVCGYYQWWANEELIEKIIKQLKKKISALNQENVKKPYKVDFDEIKNHLESRNDLSDEKLFCVYVGISKTNVLHRLISCHVMGKNRSTLRKSIGRIFDWNEIGISDFIGKLFITYRYVDEDFPLEDEEEKLINKVECDKRYFRLLNVDKNYFYRDKEYPDNENLTWILKNKIRND